jgi:hypothetical protein
MQEAAKPQGSSSTPEPIKIQDKAKIADIPKVDSPKLHDISKSMETARLVDTAKLADTPKSAEPAKSLDMPKAPDDAKVQPHRAQDAPKAQSSFMSPFLAAVAAASVFALAYTVSGNNTEQVVLEETRAKLAVVTDDLKAARDAKASVDRVLAETQAKLTAEQTARSLAEKAVADAKAVLALIPTATAPAQPSKP